MLPLAPPPLDTSYEKTCGAVVWVEAAVELGGAQEVRARLLAASGGAPCLPATLGEAFTFRIEGAPLAADRLARVEIRYSDSATAEGVLRTRTYEVRDSWPEPEACTVDVKVEGGELGAALRVLSLGEKPGSVCLAVGTHLPVAPPPWLHSPATYRYEHRADGWRLLGEVARGAAGEEWRLTPLAPGGRTGDPGLTAETCVRGGELDGPWLRFTWQSVGCLVHPPPKTPPPLAAGLEPGVVLRWSGQTWVLHGTGEPVPLAP